MRNRNNNHALRILPRIGNNSHNHNHTYGADERQKPAGGLRKRLGLRWEPLVGACAVLLFLFIWSFGQRERKQRVLDIVHSRPASQLDDDPTWPLPPDAKIPPKPISNPMPELDLRPIPNNLVINPAERLTFKTDPNPSKTTHCTTPYSPNKPLVQWALLIDAGSTGSRIHIYKFHNCGRHPEYEYEVFKMTWYDLFRFASDLEKAARTLDVLMDLAMETVPEEMKKCTPVTVKATAALRMLGVERSTALLEAVRRRLDIAYPFPVLKKDGVVILDGKDRRIYTWMTANYLLNTFRPSESNEDTTTYAVLETAGGVTEIVFKPTFTEPGAKLEEGDHKHHLDFGGVSHVLYQHSYLGYGFASVRSRVHRLLDFLRSSEKQDGADSEHDVANPCLAQGTTQRVEIYDRVKPMKKVTFVGADVGGFEACNKVMQLIMVKHEICHMKPCSFNGVYQPSLLSTFSSGPILLLPYFYDHLSLLLPRRTRNLSIETIAILARRVCAGQASWLKYWGAKAEVMKELEGRPDYCLDLTYIYALLTVGYEFGEERVVRIAEKVAGTEIAWYLGATMVMLDGAELVCEDYGAGV